MSNKAAFILVLLSLAAFVVLLERLTPPPAKEPTRLRNYPQKCLKCGNDWIIMPVDPLREVPPTTEWCFADGNFCKEGIRMAFSEWPSEKAFDDAAIAHARECEGCRMVWFTPESWKKATQ